MRLEKQNLRAWNTMKQCALTVHSPAVPFLKERFHRRYMITIRQDMVTGWTQLLAESGNVKQRPIVVDLNPEEMYVLQGRVRRGTRERVKRGTRVGVRGTFPPPLTHPTTHHPPLPLTTHPHHSPPLVRYDLVKEGESKLTWDIEVGGARSPGDGRTDARYIDEQAALRALAIDVGTFREMMGLNKVGEQPLILDSWGKEREEALAKKKAKKDAIPSYIKVDTTRS